MKKILPQANTLETVLKVFLYAGLKPNCTKEDIADYCSFDIRQADYYLSACIYLGLFDEHGKLTDKGQEIMDGEDGTYRERIYELILNDELIGRFFVHKLLFPQDDIKAYAANLTREFFPEYGDAVIERRSSALVGWCDTIAAYLKMK